MTADDGAFGRGAAAAAEVLDRLLDEFPPDVAPEVSGGDRARVVELRAAMGRALDLYADLVQQTVERYAEVAQTLIAPRPSAGPTVVALAGHAGGVATGTLWLHNTTRVPTGDVPLRLTALTAHDGGVVDGARAIFAPGAVDVGAGSSASVVLALPLAGGCAAGVYHGHVLAAGLPDAALGVRLVVTR